MSGLAAILDGIPARVALMDRDRRYRYVNEACAAFFGLSRQAILGRAAAEVIGAAAFEAVQEQGGRALAGETLRWEGWLSYGPGREPRFVQRLCQPHRDEAGDIDGYLVVVQDLTELKRDEARQVAALHMSQALNAAIIASALDCVIVIDEAGRVVEFNPAAERTFGHRRAEVLGRPMGDIIVPPHLRERHAAGFARYLATGDARLLGRRIEIEGMRADGEVFPLELALAEVRLPDQRLFTAYLRDLTPARAAAADIQRSRDAMHQTEKMAAFGSLLAGVAHELNNPLSIVVGNAMMLVEDAADMAPPLAERAGKIQTAAERCARIVRTFLSMTRQRQIALRPFAIGPLVRESLELLGYGLRTGGIAVELDIADDLPLAIGDPDQLNQVLVNLLVNAQQALAPQALPRCIAVTARAAPGELVLGVADNGPGVPPAVRDRIFEPFFTTKPMGVGTGIGLAVSRGIIEAHGGTLALAATDSGARFEVRLRLATARDGPPAPPADAPRAAPLPGLDACRALIVDDEPEVASVLAQMVRSLGLRGDTAAGGADGIRRIEAQDYDVILCDLHMADTDGAAVFAWLAGHRPHLCGRVVFITGDTLGQGTSSFLARSGRPMLEKPFVQEDIRRVLGAMPGLTRPGNPALKHD